MLSWTSFRKSAICLTSALSIPLCPVYADGLGKRAGRSLCVPHCAKTYSASATPEADPPKPTPYLPSHAQANYHKKPPRVGENRSEITRGLVDYSGALFRPLKGPILEQVAPRLTGSVCELVVLAFLRNLIRYAQARYQLLFRHAFGAHLILNGDLHLWFYIRVGFQIFSLPLFGRRC